MKQKKFIITMAVVLFGVLQAGAQSAGTSVFDFLSLPTSAHSMALGGQNVSLIDDDACLLFQNPALMSDSNDPAIALSFLTYMRGSKAGSASWTMGHGERGTWGVGAQFVSYGSMKETTVEGIEMGYFSALDMAITGGYSYTLTEHLAGGATGKFIYSNYGGYSSVALAVDLGLNLYYEDADFSLSAVAANLGGQVKAFGDKHEKLPYDLRLGLTKRLANAPIRFSVTLVDLIRWRASDYYSTDGDPKAGRILLNHFVLGIDVIPIKQLYISAGYNFRRAYEMKAAGGSHAAGLSFGAGLNIKKFHLGLAYAKYHLSAPSFMVTAQYDLK
jgi:hypothetical protein